MAFQIESDNLATPPLTNIQVLILNDMEGIKNNHFKYIKYFIYGSCVNNMK